MQRVGFVISRNGGETNCVYQVKFADKANPLKAFSKVYNASGNPTEHFAAIMTCSQAEEACPYIPGADARIAIAYDDPKNADGLPQEKATYDERTRQIAREMLYVFSLIKS
ncbi:low molecular weight phosphatase family protein [Rhodocytophaga rosea]|uniref:hypothetical protein n=1 Tax=Rhodocytophaga rosea TaxID=2704465 RepID=UPI001E300248|nr:hypothetical protein [Rhodocytophaga rosea]